MSTCSLQLVSNGPENVPNRMLSRMRGTIVLIWSAYLIPITLVKKLDVADSRRCEVVSARSNLSPLRLLRRYSSQ